MRTPSKKLEELKNNAYMKQVQEHKARADGLEQKFEALNLSYKALQMEHGAAKKTLSVHEKRVKAREDGLKKYRDKKKTPKK